MGDTRIKTLATHLEFLGYDLKPQPDGWLMALHPARWNFSIKPFEIGIRMHAQIVFGKRLANRHAWDTFIHRANDTAIFTRFALIHDDDGDWVVRVRALLPPKYDRKLFGLLFDCWHRDLDLLRNAPEATDDVEEEDEAKDEKAAARVN